VRVLILLIVLALHLSTAATGGISPPPILDQAGQLIFVVTNDWNAVDGVLYAYERRADTRNWRGARAGVPIVVGRNGMAWDVTTSMLGDVIDNGPPKREGDGRAPAGIFRLTAGFGYSAPSDQVTRLPFTQMSAAFECVDDSNSRFYNQVVDRTSVTVDWKSSEQMTAYGDQYRWGIFVDYNPTQRPGAGSCIFLHVWAGRGHGTAGCTAMPEVDLKWLLRWLSPQTSPVLVQLPRAAAAMYEKSWDLPRLR
jgi:D-alanyl-D-alanine dipeptidase